MNIKIMSGCIITVLITSVMFFGCAEKGEEKIYDIPDPVIVNVGSKYLKLDISLGVTNKKKASDQLAKILDIINQTLLEPTQQEKLEEMSGEATEKPKPSEIAEALKGSLQGQGYDYIKNIYFRTFVLQ